MRSISDKELDSLFREASDKVNYPFDPKAWELMEERLNHSGPSQRIFKYWPWLFLLLPVTGLVVVAVNSNLDFKEQLSSSMNAEFSQSQITKNTVVIPDDKQHIAGTADETSKNEATVQIDRQADEFELTADKEGTIESRTKVGHEAGFGSKNPSLSANGLNRMEESVVGAGGDKLHKLVGSGGNGMSRISETGNATTISEDALMGRVRPGGSTIAVDDEENVRIDSVSLEEESLADSPVQVAQEDTLDVSSLEPTFRKWALRLSVSPDFTTVEGSRLDKPGVNAGVMVDFNLHTHFILSVGAIYSRKIYSGYNLEYPVNGNMYVADELKGDCRMLDIPLNLYYRIKPGNKTSFFVGAGVTSYVLFKEDYTYYRDYGYGTRTYYQTVNNENRDWFSQLNLSVGVESRIKQNLAIQLEPFVKAPISGVGQGSVNLATYGAFLSLKYYPIKFK